MNEIVMKILHTIIGLIFFFAGVWRFTGSLLNWPSLIVGVFLIIMGVVVIMDQWASVPEKLAPPFAGLLDDGVGRGSFYLFIGCLCFGRGDVIGIIIGLIPIIFGIVLLVQGCGCCGKGGATSPA